LHLLTAHVPPLPPFSTTPRPPTPTLLPYTTLFRSFNTVVERELFDDGHDLWRLHTADGTVISARFVISAVGAYINPKTQPDIPGDRKSTRLNSSHVSRSYAVFCLKKKRE